MTPVQLYRRSWVVTASVLVTVLAVAGLIATTPAHWPALLLTLAASAAGGVAWSVIDRGEMCASARRVAVLAALAILVSIGAGHLGPVALLGLVLVAITCPWLPTALGRTRRHDR